MDCLWLKNQRESTGRRTPIRAEMLEVVAEGRVMALEAVQQELEGVAIRHRILDLAGEIGQ